MRDTYRIAAHLDLMREARPAAPVGSSDMTHMDLTWPIEEFARGIEASELVGKPLKLKDREVGFVTHAERQVEQHRFLLRVAITDRAIAREFNQTEGISVGNQ